MPLAPENNTKQAVPETWPADVGVLVPAYRSEASLRLFLPRLLSRLPAENICVVDDGSGDDTAAVCRGLGVRCLTHDVNRGKGAALATGFAHFVKCGRAWIITMDADGQHAPEDLPVFLDEIKRRPAMGLLIGRRARALGKMPLARIVSNTLTSLLLTLVTGRRILDSQCGYRAYATSLLQSITLTHRRFELESEVILKAAHLHFPICFVKVQTLYCSDQSHISPVKDTFRWIKAIVAIRRQLQKTPL
ncbi:MAG: glycosyltransferase family 2 protein [Chitinivibrionales bacterium]|nr:glycosyltransferase family 2 protein [Chitinivibrionales bacterium]